MARSWLVLGAAAAISFLLVAPIGHGSVQASRIVDRTLICPMRGVGFPDPVRVLEVQATPRLGDSSPRAGVYHLPGDVSASVDTGPDFGRGTGSLVLRGCAPSGLLVRLSSQGLRGGPTALGNRQRCEVPARILIRLRAVFDRPVILRREKGLLIARGRIATGSVAVATLPGRKPLAFASVHDSTGKAQLFAARASCRKES
jgi:hypothetical protein